MSNQPKVDVDALPDQDQIKELFGVDVTSIKEGVVVATIGPDYAVVFGNGGNDPTDEYVSNHVLFAAFLKAIENDSPALAQIVQEFHDLQEGGCFDDDGSDDLPDADQPMDASIPKNRTLN